MKIGLVCPYNIARGGGVQEIVRAMKHELEARGHEAKIITPQPRDIGDLNTEGIIFLGSATDFRSPFHTTSQVSATIDNEVIEQMLETEQFDVLHFHEPWVPLLSRQILSRSNAVNIGTFHAKIPETVMSRTVVKVVTPYSRSVIKSLHEITAVSDAAAEYIGSLTNQPIAIIPNGIDLKHYKKSAKTRPEGSLKTILYLGRLERRKGLKYLLKAYNLLTQDHDNVQLIVAGDGPDRQKMEDLVAELELPNVTFLGYVNDQTKLDLLASADLYCSPALYGESFGIVLLEAMATGTVTVAGNNSGYASVMRDTGALSLVTPTDTPEFARRLDLLLNDASLRKAWLNWAHTAVKQYSYPKVVDMYEELYETALRQHAESLAHARA